MNGANPAFVRQLRPDDEHIFHDLRLRAFDLCPFDFRVSVEDQLATTPEQRRQVLAAGHVVAGFTDDEPVALGALSPVGGTKLRHRGLLWSMYVDAAHRGTGLVDAIMEQLLAAAEGGYEATILTVVDTNIRAKAFYTRWGFAQYGVDRRAIKLPDGTYLDEALMSRPAGMHPTGSQRDRDSARRDQA